MLPSHPPHPKKDKLKPKTGNKEATREEPWEESKQLCWQSSSKYLSKHQSRSSRYLKKTTMWGFLFEGLRVSNLHLEIYKYSNHNCFTSWGLWFVFLPLGESTGNSASLRKDVVIYFKIINHSRNDGKQHLPCRRLLRKSDLSFSRLGGIWRHNNKAPP